VSKRRYFDKSVSHWDNLYDREVLSSIKDLVQRFKIKKGASVLDLGSGTGVLLPFLLKSAGNKGEVFAIDFSLKMLLKAKSKKGNEKAKFINADAEKLPFKKDLFDSVICFGSFAHFPDKRKALKEISRVLKNGSEIFIAHLLSSEEVKIHHQHAGDEVEKDVLPKEKTMKSWMTYSGFKGIEIIDRPSLYLASGSKR